jgi:NTE family protein
MSIGPGSVTAGPSFLDGISAAAAADLLDGLELRRFPSGSVVIEEGDFPRRIYLTESGEAEVEVADLPIGRIRPGTTIGEMSLFTGLPASATVRAVDELVVRVISDAELERIGLEHPQVYRNLAAILADRLAHTSQLAARRETAKLALLRGASPFDGYALACSVAWHTREPAVLLVAGDAPELEQYAAELSLEARAHVVFAAEGSVRERVETLTPRYPHVLVHAPRLTPRDLPETRAIEVPHLGRSAIDEDGLALGALSSARSGGKAAGRVAREIAGLTVGLALGAGSMRGYAHVGVIRGLQKIGLEVDYICGSSIGAAVAAGFALGYDETELDHLLDRTAKVLFRPTVPVRGFMSSGPLGRFLREIYQGKQIEELAIPLGVVAADLPSHREIVFRRGPLWRAVLASVSIPGVYPAQRMGNYTLVDGGVVNAVPAGVASDMGAANVIAVRLVSPPFAPDTNAEATEPTGRPPSALITILRAIEIMQSRTSREGGAATVTISPKLEAAPGAKLRNFGDGKRFADLGEAAFEAALPRIASVLPWVRT